MSLKEPYCTVTKADEILASDSAWTTATEPTKTDALVKARYWMDANFMCDVPADVPEELMYANAWLAADHVAGGLYDTSNRKEQLKMKRVKASSAEVEKEYAIQSRFLPKSYDLVRSVLVGYCVNAGGVASPIVRA